MSDIPKIPAEAKEIIKHKRTGKIYANKEEFDADVADPNTDTTQDDFRQDLEITVTRVNIEALTKKYWNLEAQQNYKWKCCKNMFPRIF